MFNTISNQVFYTLGLYDIWNMLDNQQKETLTEAINIGIDEGIKQFANQMEFKLKRNDYKGGWDECDIHFLLKFLKREVAELEKSISFGNKSDVIKEAADVANFAMMIADISREEKLR